MTKAHRNINIAAVLLPFVAFLAGFRCSGTTSWGPPTCILLVSLYAISVVGITVGFHRLLTHSAFATHSATEYVWRDPRLARRGGPR